ncbi:unnamed protein product [Malus baccata var. baccata]
MGVRFGERKEREEQGDGLESANGGKDLQGLQCSENRRHAKPEVLASNNSNSKSCDSGLLQDRFTDLCKMVFVIGRELLQASCKSVQRNQDLLISNASAIGNGTANEKTESIVICVLTVKMYFRLFLRSGRITPPNWTSNWEFVHRNIYGYLVYHFVFYVNVGC